MTGAKTGQTRVVPLMYVPYRDGVILVGSQGGTPKSPQWAHNLVANPDIGVQHKSREMRLKARRASAQARHTRLHLRAPLSPRAARQSEE